MREIKGKAETNRIAINNAASVFLSFLIAHTSDTPLSEDECDSIVNWLKSIAADASNNRSEALIRTSMKASASSVIRQHSQISKADVPWDIKAEKEQTAAETPAGSNPFVGSGIRYGEDLADWSDLVSRKPRTVSPERNTFDSSTGIELKGDTSSHENVRKNGSHPEASSASLRGSFRLTSPEIVAGAREKGLVFGCFIRASSIEIGETQTKTAFEEERDFAKRVQEIIQSCFCDAVGCDRIRFEKESRDGIGFTFDIEKEVGHIGEVGSKLVDLPTTIKRSLELNSENLNRYILSGKENFNRITMSIDWNHTDDTSPAFSKPLQISKDLTRSESLFGTCEFLITRRAFIAGTSKDIGTKGSFLWFGTQFERLPAVSQPLFKPTDGN